MQQHTPEPWKVYDDKVFFQYRPSSIICICWDAGADKDANESRIVACVNACTGIDYPEKYIPAMRQEMKDIRSMIDADDNEATIDEIERLKTAKDALYAALHALVFGHKVKL